MEAVNNNPEKVSPTHAHAFSPSFPALTCLLPCPARLQVALIGELCGFNITSARVPSAALKDIADGFGFLSYEGLSIKGTCVVW